MHKETVDVLIIGAGPAGLKCAEVLGDSNLSVLVLEKNKVVGPKVCAGGMTGLALGEELPVDNALLFYRHHVFVNGRERVVSLQHPISMIDRRALGDFQLNRVKRFRNVRVQPDRKVVSVTHDSACTKGGDTICFRYLVGADGATSLVRRYLDLKTRLYAGMQYTIPKNYTTCCWFVEPRHVRSGYAWIFPHKGFTSAGVYFNPQLVTVAKANGFLNSIINRFGLDHPEARLEAAPINCRYDGIKFKNIFLAGEAAGLVSAATGEGISYALISGRDVGRHIKNQGYNFDATHRILRYKRRQEKALSVLDSLPSLLQSVMFVIFVTLSRNRRMRRYFEEVA